MKAADKVGVRVSMGTASSAKVTLLSQWLRLIIQTVGFVVLSRLLSPSDFGLVAMVAVIVSIAATLGDFGLSLAGIQASVLSQAQKSTLFLVNAAAGAVGAGLVVACTPAVAAFYDERSLLAITPALAAPLLFNSLGVQSRVELNRAGRFGALALLEVLSSAGGLLVGIGAAIGQLGPWALVLQSVGQSFILLVLSVAIAMWLPSRLAPFREVRSLLRFGSHTFVLQIANLASTTADVASIGRVQGVESLGVYSRSSQVISMVFAQLVAPLTRVLLPRLARSTSAGDFERDLVRLERVSTYPLLAAISLLAALSPAAIPLVFGTDWAPMGGLVQIMCIGAAFQACGYVFYWATLATARTGLLLWAELPGRVVMIVGAIALAPVGIHAVAWVMAVGQLTILIGSSIAIRRVSVDAIRVLAVVVRPACVFGAAFVCASVATLVSPLGSIGQLLVASGVWLLCAVGSVVMPSVRRDLVMCIRAIAGVSS